MKQEELMRVNHAKEINQEQLNKLSKESLQYQNEVKNYKKIVDELKSELSFIGEQKNNLNFNGNSSIEQLNSSQIF